MPLRREAEGGPGSNLSRNPARHQSPRDHVVDQRGAKTRLLRREGKLLQHLGGNLEADPKNQRKRKRRSTFPRSRQKRSSEDGQLILPHNSIFLFLVKFWDRGRNKESSFLAFPAPIPNVLTVKITATLEYGVNQISHHVCGCVMFKGRTMYFVFPSHVTGLKL